MNKVPVSALGDMLASMEPVLFREPYKFLSSMSGQNLAREDDTIFALVYESEGLTCVMRADPRDDAVLFARISLSVHSDLEAVGLTAAVGNALSQAGIACNVIAAFHHDHVFVPWSKREEALAILKRLSEDARR